METVNESQDSVMSRERTFREKTDDVRVINNMMESEF